MADSVWSKISIGGNIPEHLAQRIVDIIEEDTGYLSINFEEYTEDYFEFEDPHGLGVFPETEKFL